MDSATMQDHVYQHRLTLDSSHGNFCDDLVIPVPDTLGFRVLQEGESNSTHNEYEHNDNNNIWGDSTNERGFEHMLHQTLLDFLVLEESAPSEPANIALESDFSTDQSESVAHAEPFHDLSLAAWKRAVYTPTTPQNATSDFDFDIFLSSPPTSTLSSPLISAKDEIGPLTIPKESDFVSDDLFEVGGLSGPVICPKMTTSAQFPQSPPLSFCTSKHRIDCVSPSERNIHQTYDSSEDLQASHSSMPLLPSFEAQSNFTADQSCFDAGIGSMSSQPCWGKRVGTAFCPSPMSYLTNMSMPTGGSTSAPHCDSSALWPDNPFSIPPMPFRSIQNSWNQIGSRIGVGVRDVQRQGFCHNVRGCSKHSSVDSSRRLDGYHRMSRSGTTGSIPTTLSTCKTLHPAIFQTQARAAMSSPSSLQAPTVVAPAWLSLHDTDQQLQYGSYQSPTRQCKPNQGCRATPTPSTRSRAQSPDINQAKRKSASQARRKSASTSSKSPRRVSAGFINFTPSDSSKLLGGVAPSGSSKTKARREKEAADRRRRAFEAAKRAVQQAGGDLEDFNAWQEFQVSF